MVGKGSKFRHNDISRILALTSLRSLYVNTWTDADISNNGRWTLVGSANLPNIYSQDATDTNHGSLMSLRVIWTRAVPLMNGNSY